MADTKKNQVAKGTATDKQNKSAKAAKAEAPAPKGEKKPSAPAAKLNKPRLKELYEKDAVPMLMKKFGYGNINEVPKLVKVTLNMGLGDIKENSKSLQLAAEEMKTIAGQKALLTKAKRSVANFKLRQNMVVGCKVTLRGVRMWEFFDKFVSIALPRVRDFRGVPADSFDGRGNYALGIKEQLIFPEISYDKIEKIRGMDICVVTTAKTDEEARELLRALGMPFKAN